MQVQSLPEIHQQFVLNGGTAVGTSIPATEHSVMTSWPEERDAIERMVDEFGDGLFACVLDSYDYSKVCDGDVLLWLGKVQIWRGTGVMRIVCMRSTLRTSPSTHHIITLPGHQRAHTEPC